jgi:hypothetical protein
MPVGNGDSGGQPCAPPYPRNSHVQVDPPSANLNRFVGFPHSLT